jgi:hypothetical protein
MNKRLNHIEMGTRDIRRDLDNKFRLAFENAGINVGNYNISNI